MSDAVEPSQAQSLLQSLTEGEKGDGENFVLYEFYNDLILF